jgi:CDP-glucose 4,6-dehydratase
VSPELGAESWVDRPVLVTGGSGLAGGWLVQRLLALQAHVVCLVRDWVPGSTILGAQVSGQTFVFGDVRDQALVERALGDYEIEVVFHLAAQTIVPIANRNPVETFDSNIRGTWSVLEACRRSPAVDAVLVASSDKAYGSQVALPYREDTALSAIHPYDVSKAAADMIARSYAATYELPVAVIRAGNFFGGGDLNWSRVVPGTIRAALREKQPVIRSDGTPLRDYLYIEDAVDAYVLLAEALLSGRMHGEAVNISYGQPLSVHDVVRAVMAEVGSTLEPIIEGTAKHEIQDQYLDSSLASEQLGWSPPCGFDEGMRRTVAWYREYVSEIGLARSDA